MKSDLEHKHAALEEEYKLTMEVALEDESSSVRGAILPYHLRSAC